MTNAKRSDTGQYRLQLRNQYGFDTATVHVRVLDRPNPPENLRADEFAGDALTLYWNPPKDNGGADISNYIVEKREARSSTWSKVSIDIYIQMKIIRVVIYIYIYTEGKCIYAHPPILGLGVLESHVNHELPS